MRRCVLLVAPLTALTALTPAHAEEGRVSYSRVIRYTHVGNGYLVHVACSVTAVPGDDQAAVATSVHCDVNGTSSDAVVPGATAVTVVNTATLL